MRGSILVVLVVGCVNAGAGTQGTSDPPLDGSSCRQLDDEFDLAVRDRGTCDADADCVVTRGQALPPGWTPSCECPPTIGSSGAIAIAIDAPGRARAQELTRAFQLHCVEATDAVELCDGRGLSAARCVDHRCVGVPDAPCPGH